jgi:hypothetical protein
MAAPPLRSNKTMRLHLPDLGRLPFASALDSRPVPGVQIPVVHREDVADLVAWNRAFGNPSGGLLIRPDGVVGWRSDGIPPDPSAAVASARTLPNSDLAL